MDRLKALWDSSKAAAYVSCPSVSMNVDSNVPSFLLIIAAFCWKAMVPPDSCKAGLHDDGHQSA